MNSHNLNNRTENTTDEVLKRQAESHEPDNIESKLKSDIKVNLEDQIESFLGHKKPKHSKRLDKHHHFDDSEPTEEQHQKKRDSGKRRHRINRIDFKSSDKLEEY